MFLGVLSVRLTWQSRPWRSKPGVLGGERVELQLDIGRNINEHGSTLPQSSQRLEADRVDGNQVAQMQSEGDRVVAAYSNQIGNLRVRESAGEPNDTVIGLLIDLDPALHSAVRSGKSPAIDATRATRARLLISTAGCDFVTTCCNRSGATFRLRCFWKPIYD